MRCDLLPWLLAVGLLAGGLLLTPLSLALPFAVLAWLEDRWPR